MDRIEFSKSIICDDVQETIVKYINQTMALYDIMENYNDIRITRTISDNIASFSLQFQNMKEANQLHGCINGSSIYIYEKTYRIQTSVLNNTVELLLIE